MADSTRPRGRSRGRGRGDESSEQLRRPAEHGTAPYTIQPPHVRISVLLLDIIQTVVCITLCIECCVVFLCCQKFNYII